MITIDLRDGDVSILRDWDNVSPEDLSYSERLEAIEALMDELRSASKDSKRLSQIRDALRQSDATPLIVVTKMNQTCFACPSQWDGETADGRSVYVRFRHGHLRIDISNETVYSTSDVEGDGVMSYDELKGYTSHLFVWPDTCTSDDSL